MNFRTIDRAARAFIASIGVRNRLVATHNAETTWMDGHISYRVKSVPGREITDALALVKVISNEFGLRPAFSGRKSQREFYLWEGRKSGNRIGLMLDYETATVIIGLVDPHYRATAKAKPLDESALHRAGVIERY